jgi:hypothetical protein
VRTYRKTVYGLVSDYSFQEELLKFSSGCSPASPESLRCKYAGPPKSEKGEEVMPRPKLLNLWFWLIILVTWNFLLVADAGAAKSAAQADYQQMLATARNYVKANCAPGITFDLKLIKQVKDYALMEVVPTGKWASQVEPAGVILQKIGGRWVPQELGTDFSDWEQKVPELFKR